MSKILYLHKRFNGKSQQHIALANEIIASYNGDGLSLTLRQLYYQFIARNAFPNSKKSYKNLGQLINDARLAGLIDWDAIVDRTRHLKGLQTWESASDAVSDRAAEYRIDRWKNQPKRVEVWVEKDALSGVIRKPCDKWRVDYFSCRGYTSQTVLHDAAERHKQYERGGQKTTVLHLGDHDPSGRDMTRDIADRFEMFGAKVRIKRIALNVDQIRKYNPPPNPAIITDSRFEAYKKEFGTKSWELDALEPRVIVALIDKEIKALCDMKLWEKSGKDEENQQESIDQAAEDLRNA